MAKVHRRLEEAKDQWQREGKQQHLRLVADRPVVDMDMEPEVERLEVHQSTYLRCQQRSWLGMQLEGRVEAVLAERSQVELQHIRVEHWRRLAGHCCKLVQHTMAEHILEAGHKRLDQSEQLACILAGHTEHLEQ